MKGIVLSDLLNEAKTVEAPKPKPIKITAILMETGEWNVYNYELRANRKYVLIQKEYFSDTEYPDLFLAVEHGIETYLYRGHWNDGVTE